MKRFLILNVIVIITISGCSGALDENNPESVAQAFWLSALSSDPSQAKQFMKNGEVLAIDIIGQNVKDSASIGEVVEQNGYYFINTTLSLWRKERQVSIPLQTVIVPVDGRWKVDYWSTKQTVVNATMDRTMKYFASTVNDADKYLKNILGVQDQEKALQIAETKIDAEFKNAKKIFLLNLEAGLEKTAQKSLPKSQ